MLVYFEVVGVDTRVDIDDEFCMRRHARVLFLLLTKFVADGIITSCSCSCCREYDNEDNGLDRD
jgi:hypothetical protein